MRKTEAEALQALQQWRVILKTLCEDPSKKREIAEELYVSLRTVDRWISGTSNPQKEETIRQLYLLQPEMRDSLQSEFPDVFRNASQSSDSFAMNNRPVSLPIEFSQRVLHAYTHVTALSRRWTVWNLVSNQMLPHLDRDRTGLLVIYTRVQEKKLLFAEAAGTIVWATRQLIQDSTEAEGRITQAVANGQPFFLQSCSLSFLFHTSCIVHSDHVHSIGFFPIRRAGLAAGGMLLLSTQEDFFTPHRQALIEEYSHLCALAFSDTDFSTQHNPLEKENCE